MKYAKELGESIFKNCAPAIMEFAEDEIDDLIQNQTFKNIPILGTISSFIKIGKDFRERNLLRQTAIFYSEFTSRRISESKLREYRNKLKDDKKLIEELERILILLDRNIDDEKSRYIAKLYIACIENKIKWEEFCEFTDITNRFYIEDYRILRMLWDRRSRNQIKADDEFRVERIYSTGMVGINPATIGGGAHVVQGRKLNHMGKTYCDIIFSQE